jgi:hypothetical protein
MPINPYQSPAEATDRGNRACRPIQQWFGVTAAISGGLALLLWSITPSAGNFSGPETAARFRFMHLATGVLIGTSLTSAAACRIIGARPRIPPARSDGENTG